MALDTGIHAGEAHLCITMSALRGNEVDFWLGIMRFIMTSYITGLGQGSAV
jgi:hypothetical protein